MCALTPGFQVHLPDATALSREQPSLFARLAARTLIAPTLHARSQGYAVTIACRDTGRAAGAVNSIK